MILRSLTLKLCKHPLIFGGLLLLSATAFTASHAQAQAQSPSSPLLSWSNAPSLPVTGKAEEQTRAAFAADGKRAAFLMNGHIWVHQVLATGALGAQLYTSPPTQKVTAFVWAGQKLFVSRQAGAKSETVSLTFAPKVAETPLLPLTAASLRLAPGGEKLALVPLDAPNKNDTRIEFFQHQGSHWTKYGSYVRPATGALERYWKNSNFGRPQWLYLLGWNDDARGVFAVVPAVTSDEEGKPPSKAQQICLILPEGVALPLSRPGDLGPYFRPHMLPMAGLVARNGIRAVPIGHEFISEFGTMPAPRNYLMSVQPPAWQDEDKMGQGDTVAYLPNTRYALQQLSPSTGKAELIVSDLDQGLWKSLGHTTEIVTAHGWNGQNLLVRTRNPKGALQWGLLRLPSDFLTQTAGWKKPGNGRETPDAAEQKVLDFFKTPNVASYAPLRPFLDDFRSDTDEPHSQGFSFWGREYEPYIRVDTTLKRVVFFDGPDADAPFPDKPIAPEKASQSALEFLRQLSPNWLQPTAPTISVAPLGSNTNYRVRFDFPNPTAGSPAACLVTVRASDGQINGYDESATRIDRIWKSVNNSTPADSQASPALVDTLRPSPDGHFLLFRSNLPHPDYPAWWSKRPVGLYLLDLRASDAQARLVAPDAGAPYWSPNSQRFAFSTGGDGYKIGSIDNDQLLSVPSPPVSHLTQKLLGWKSDDELLIGMHMDGDGWPDLSGMDLRIFHPSAPTRMPTLWKALWSAPFGYTAGFKSAALAPDGKTLAVAWNSVMGAKRISGDPTTIWLYPLDKEGAAPRALRTDASSSVQLMWAPSGLLVADGSSTNGVPDLTITDVATGKVAPWSLPAPVAELLGRLRVRQNSIQNDAGFRFSSDGKTLFFAGLEAMSSVNNPTLFTANPDGSNLRPLIRLSPRIRLG